MKQDNENNYGAQTLQVVAPASHSAEPLALINCGEFSLLISSKDIVTLISAQKLLASKTAHACGEVEFEQKVIPVFVFNKALQLQPRLPSAHMTVVVLQHESRLFAICCSGLEKLNAADLHFHKVPLSMSNRKQPFAEFAIVNNIAAGLSSAAELWRLLSLRKAVQTMPLVQMQVLIQGAG